MIVLKEIKKPKWWNTTFAQNVIDAYEAGKLTYKTISQWEKDYNGGIQPHPSLGTKEILDYYLATK